MTIRRTVAHQVRETVHDKEVETEAARWPHWKRSLPQIIGKPARHTLCAFKAPVVGRSKHAIQPVLISRDRDAALN